MQRSKDDSFPVGIYCLKVATTSILCIPFVSHIYSGFPIFHTVLPPAVPYFEITTFIYRSYFCINNPWDRSRLFSSERAWKKNFFYAKFSQPSIDFKTLIFAYIRSDGHLA